jgi:tellurite methyltransferase
MAGDSGRRRQQVSKADREKWNKRYREGAYAERSHPSALLEEWAGIIPPGRALDLACGAGRNALFLAGLGFAVDAIDISGDALLRARETAQRAALKLNWIEHDLDEPLPLDARYQLILVVRYVNLPLIQRLAASLAPGGFLVCEEHLVTEADVVGPTNPAFRVAPGDLLAAAGGLKIHYLQEGVVAEPDGRFAALAQLVAQSIQPE